MCRLRARGGYLESCKRLEVAPDPPLRDGLLKREAEQDREENNRGIALLKESVATL